MQTPITPGGGDESVGPVNETVLPDHPESSAFESLLRQVARVAVDADPSPMAELAPGVIVGGRFEVVREIGRGGFARVFEARDQVLSRPVAIKLLRRRRRLDDSDLELLPRGAGYSPSEPSSHRDCSRLGGLNDARSSSSSSSTGNA